MNIIVTGASRGIGLEIVKLLSGDSSHHVVAIARNTIALQKLKEQCLRINPLAKIKIIPYDLSAIGSDLISEIISEIGYVDVLINNVGVLVNKPFEEITEHDLHNTYQVNVFSVVKLIQGLVNYMGKSGKGHIVNISSIGGFQGSQKFAGLSAYSSSKAALANLTECLAEEFRDRNIAVNCLALGAAQTEMLSQAFPEYKAPVTALKMAEFITYFALNGHYHFNGKILPVAQSTP